MAFSNRGDTCTTQRLHIFFVFFISGNGSATTHCVRSGWARLYGFHWRGPDAGKGSFKKETWDSKKWVEWT
ncbi:hypothetical protein LZ31DRAFT_331333 [Colletotrichum somersetense]|nr:hypothetical protein LZ31DRAFT_331333 [Colletotrichum somersetense]